MQIFRQAMAVSETHIKTIEEWVVPRWKDESAICLSWQNIRRQRSQPQILRRFSIFKLLLIRIIASAAPYFCTSSCHARSPECMARPIISDTWLQHLFICCDIFTCHFFNGPNCVKIPSSKHFTHTLDHSFILKFQYSPRIKESHELDSLVILCQRSNPPTIAIVSLRENNSTRVTLSSCILSREFLRGTDNKSCISDKDK